MKTESSLISIIVPVYNVELYIKKCLDSLVNQTYLNIEIIVVNDGSQDSSTLIIEEYAQKYNKIKIFNKVNGGLSDARNYGIDVSTGEFLLFVDSDDYVDIGMVEKLYHALLQTHAEIVVCDMLYVFENGTQKYSSGGTFNQTNISNNPELLLMNNSACNKLFKRDLFIEHRFIKGIWYEDLATIPKIIMDATLIVKVDEPLYYYVQRNSSIIHTQNKKIFDIYSALREVLNYIDKKDLDVILTRYFNRMAVIQGVELTNLRIKEYDSKQAEYFALNHQKITEIYPNWFMDEYVWSNGFKKFIGFMLFKFKLFNVLMYLYKK